jgi:hypothetical protein
MEFLKSLHATLVTLSLHGMPLNDNIESWEVSHFEAKDHTFQMFLYFKFFTRERSSKGLLFTLLFLLLLLG